jgi:hypothetical protein
MLSTTGSLRCAEMKMFCIAYFEFLMVSRLFPSCTTIYAPQLQHWQDGVHFKFQKKSSFEKDEICAIVEEKSQSLVSNLSP